jgi:hypothetical protein
MTGPPSVPPGVPPGWQPPPRQPGNSTGTVVGLAVVGVLLFGAINLVLGLLVLVAASGPNGPAAVGVGAVSLALVAFGGGAGLIALHKPWTKGLGIGLMIGWALLSITSVGFCTGLNPEMYTGGSY